MQNVPAGGNSNNAEFTVIDDKDKVKQLWNRESVLVILLQFLLIFQKKMILSTIRFQE